MDGVAGTLVPPSGCSHLRLSSGIALVDFVPILPHAIAI
jgi:hypothetical protein